MGLRQGRDITKCIQHYPHLHNQRPQLTRGLCNLLHHLVFSKETTSTNAKRLLKIKISNSIFQHNGTSLECWCGVTCLREARHSLLSKGDYHTQNSSNIMPYIIGTSFSNTRHKCFKSCILCSRHCTCAPFR